MSKLEGKVAVVTGGSSGIGLATAERFVAEGARVFIVGRRAVELERAAERLGVEPIVADVTDAEALARVFATVAERTGRIDTLVVSAGMAEPSPLSATTPEHVDRLFDLNVRAALFTVQGALPLMNAGSTIVLIGSIASVVGTPGYGTYGATKAALRAYARTWTSELASRGIRVNTLSPGPIDTPIFDAQAKTPEAAAEVRKHFTSLIPLGRMGRPSEVAAAALFLASDESSFMAGAELCLDGGAVQV